MTHRAKNNKNTTTHPLGNKRQPEDRFRGRRAGGKRLGIAAVRAAGWAAGTRVPQSTCDREGTGQSARAGPLTAWPAPGAERCPAPAEGTQPDLGQAPGLWCRLLAADRTPAPPRSRDPKPSWNPEPRSAVPPVERPLVGACPLQPRSDSHPHDPPSTHKKPERLGPQPNF